MPAAEKHKLVYETPNYVISHAAARWYHCTTVNYRDSSVRGYHDKTVFPFGVSPCPCSCDKTVCGQPVSSVAPLLELQQEFQAVVNACFPVTKISGLTAALESSHITDWSYGMWSRHTYYENRLKTFPISLLHLCE
jgi:hypothetical protein